MKSSILKLIFLFFTISSFSQNGGENFIDHNFIEVLGTAEMEIIPDEIQISISVSEKDFKTKQAFDDYEKQIIAKFKEIGISVENDFSILNINGSLKVSVFGENTVFFTRQYMVVVHNAETANKVFNEMEKIGVKTIAITKFDHSQIQKFRLDVKISAIKAAKEKAQALTAAIGQTIGRALYINEENNNYYQPNIFGNVALKNKLESDLGEIEKVNFQKIRLSYSILVRFELK